MLTTNTRGNTELKYTDDKPADASDTTVPEIVDGPDIPGEVDLNVLLDLGIASVQKPRERSKKRKQPKTGPQPKARPVQTYDHLPRFSEDEETPQPEKAEESKSNTYSVDYESLEQLRQQRIDEIGEALNKLTEGSWYYRLFFQPIEELVAELLLDDRNNGDVGRAVAHVQRELDPRSKGIKMLMGWKAKLDALPVKKPAETTDSVKPKAEKPQAAPTLSRSDAVKLELALANPFFSMLHEGVKTRLQNGYPAEIKESLPRAIKEMERLRLEALLELARTDAETIKGISNIRLATAMEACLFDVQRAMVLMKRHPLFESMDENVQEMIENAQFAGLVEFRLRLINAIGITRGKTPLKADAPFAKLKARFKELRMILNSKAVPLKESRHTSDDDPFVSFTEKVEKRIKPVAPRVIGESTAARKAREAQERLNDRIDGEGNLAPVVSDKPVSMGPDKGFKIGPANAQPKVPVKRGSVDGIGGGGGSKVVRQVRNNRKAKVADKASGKK